jgi:hypothetical protein
MEAQVFDWDEENIAHIARHGVMPAEAEEALTIAPMDIAEQHHDEEVRYVQLGTTANMRILLVVSTWRGDLVRVVTAYPASSSLRENYAEERRNNYGN